MGFFSFQGCHPILCLGRGVTCPSQNLGLDQNLGWRKRLRQVGRKTPREAEQGIWFPRQPRASLQTLRGSFFVLLIARCSYLCHLSRWGGCQNGSLREGAAFHSSFFCRPSSSNTRPCLKSLPPPWFGVRATPKAVPRVVCVPPPLPPHAVHETSPLLRFGCSRQNSGLV